MQIPSKNTYKLVTLLTYDKNIFFSTSKTRTLLKS